MSNASSIQMHSFQISSIALCIPLCCTLESDPLRTVEA